LVEVLSLFPRRLSQGLSDQSDIGVVGGGNQAGVVEENVESISLIVKEASSIR